MANMNGDTCAIWADLELNENRRCARLQKQPSHPRPTYRFRISHPCSTSPNWYEATPYSATTVIRTLCWHWHPLSFPPRHTFTMARRGRQVQALPEAIANKVYNSCPASQHLQTRHQPLPLLRITVSHGALEILLPWTGTFRIIPRSR